MGIAGFGRFAASAAVLVAAGTATALLFGAPTAVGDPNPASTNGSASADAESPGNNGSQAEDADPPGNNGTIKISKPSVDCTVRVDFYGFDEGDLNADLTFWAHPPTAPNGPFDTELLVDTVFVGEDDNSGGGSEAGLDASRTYTLDLSGIEPHRVKGWHIRLDVRAHGAQGANLKHKVFWVTGCEGPSPAPSQTS